MTLARCACAVAGGIALLLAAAGALAHFTGQSYIFLRVYESGLEGRVELPTRDLDAALGLDTDGDGEVSATELEARTADIEAMLAARFSLAAQGQPYAIRYTSRSLREIEIGHYLVAHFVVDRPGTIPDVIDVSYSAIMDAVPAHRGGLVVEHNAKIGLENNHTQFSFIFAPGREHVALNLLGEGRLRALWRFVREGAFHIWIGIDHVLFLVALVLPAVMVRRAGRWHPVESFRPAMMHVVKVVTLFTVAHSITLSLAALNVVQLPARLVETVIALSVLLVALNNLYPLFNERIWWVVFGFGLFHGFGFAAVLSELALTRSSKIMSLFGFNIGVEIGQLAIIATLFPLLYLARRQAFYRPVGLAATSVLISLAALAWFVSRAFEVELI